MPQIDRYQKLKVVDLQRTMDRAALNWNDDRCVYINQLAAHLGVELGVGPASLRPGRAPNGY